MPQVIVKGMSCGHCQKAVQSAIEKINGTSQVTVDLQSGNASWVEAGSPVNRQEVIEAITKIGFTAE